MTATERGPLVVLVGVPGAGKSSVGSRVAELLGVGFRDTDHDIVAATGREIADIFVDEGEEQFRRLEEEAVARGLAEHRGVLALGGGAVTRPATRARLRGHRVVHLGVSAAAAAKRVGLARERPVLALNPRATLTRLLAERAPLYAEVSTDTVDTDERDPEAVAAAVVALLGLEAGPEAGAGSASSGPPTAPEPRSTQP
ncbi:MAG: shikimate kinase [Actinomycetota bacterium]|nr:shikimate kinase [Actinomycetota bacterium]